MKTTIFHTAACTAVLLLAPAAQALPFVLLDQSVLVHIPAKDVPDFKSFIGKALNEGAADTVTEWHSSARAGQPAVQVLLTPGAGIATRSAGQCRLLSAQVHQRSHAESWKVWFCQQADGRWKISGLQ
ncbi:hypothetical protein [Pantoea sp. 18069]|uniref:hypothetical protein n=1 Tax=Pantoea sp. 18069 TaxID=2681415 RepID=UPI00135AB82F|nr:hypothetical protein [Pantoea sp. 18069]